MIKTKILIWLMIIILLITNVFAGSDKMDPWTDLPYFESIDSVGIFDWGDFDQNYEPGQELNWYPLEDWEYQVCSQTLTSEFTYDTVTEGHGGPDNRVYDQTVTVNAELRETEFTNEDDDKEYLLSVGWYLQAANLNNAEDEVTYKVRISPESYFLPLADNETEETFTLITGASGFHSEYTTTNIYNEVDLIVDNTFYTFDIVKIDLDGQTVSNFGGE